MPQKQAAAHWRHGERVTYAWLRDRDDPRVRALIDAENSDTETCLGHTNVLRQQLYEEMLNRVELSRQTVPVRHGTFEYYSRHEDEKPYPIHCRRRVDCEGPEELVLDENDLARGNAYFALEFLQVSPDHTRCIFGIDTAGDERFALFVKELVHRFRETNRVPRIHFYRHGL